MVSVDLLEFYESLSRIEAMQHKLSAIDDRVSSVSWMITKENLLKLTIKIKLSSERGKLLMIKVIRNNFFSKPWWILNNKSFTIRSPVALYYNL